ncbi:histone-lysine N-methyltransferase 2A-like [Metopolophium dirhodum]|uniref:histone-lysine N-methyltransferase 2A-like n=1 Tax=Metopolophium dirhodum TaxID=44670 RepID=UPI00298FA9F6|nr:histone-lysine N-methyltransferase 2A-like [Metopolophium dirhodum]
MPKNKQINYEEPIPKRPHRNMKAKIVFDPSDTHIPKKRSKHSYTNKKPMEATTIKKTTNDGRKQKDTTKSKCPSVTDVTELLDCMSTEINTISQIHSPIQLQVKRVTPKVTLDTSKNCCICSKILGKTELIDCPICFIKVHKHCLVVSEPMWKFKLDMGPWFCKQCRKHNCHKCLRDESQSEILRRCITCEVGLHIICYESYEIKPLHKLETDMYVCIPCMTLATQINPEEEEDVVEAVQFDVDDNVKSCPSSIVSISSDSDDTGSESNTSDNSSEYYKYDKPQIPNISKWTKKQVFEYLSEKLPKETAHQIIKYDLDGQALLLLQRTDIVSNMGLKLGHALALYKQVRILQSQSTLCRIFWE